MTYTGDFRWSDEPVRELRELIERGLSNTQIADELRRQFKKPITKDCIAGKRFRLRHGNTTRKVKA